MRRGTGVVVDVEVGVDGTPVDRGGFLGADQDIHERDPSGERCSMVYMRSSGRELR